MSTYIWCEDSKSGFSFWKEIFSVINSEFIIESKENNTRLRKAVNNITDENNTYYILIDYAMDNADVVREYQYIYRICRKKKNVIIINIHSFEFVLLSFKMLDEWIFAEQDELKEKRNNLIEYKNRFVDIIINGGDAEKLDKLKESDDIDKSLNTEQISSSLLYKITRNTGFETSKSKLGKCFVNNCCEWSERQSDDICGLDTIRPNADNKKKQLIKFSVLKEAFMKAGIYNDNSL